MIVSSGDCIDGGTRVHLMSFLGQDLMILCEFYLYTCRPAGALEFGVSMFLQTCGISIVLIIHSLDPLGLKCVGFRDFIKPCNQHNASQEREP